MIVLGLLYFVFFVKQKTAYEMRISDWSSDVCSSDLDDDTIAEPAGGRRLIDDRVVIGFDAEAEPILPIGKFGIERPDIGTNRICRTPIEVGDQSGAFANDKVLAQRVFERDIETVDEIPKAPRIVLLGFAAVSSIIHRDSQS